MAHIVERADVVDKHTFAGLDTAIMVVLIGSGLAACVIGAFIYDVGRWLSAW
jgi:hypothetical protein